MKRSKKLLKVATWNVNSIKVRLPRLLNFLEREDPDIVCLQELKCVEEQFPFEELKAAGYQAAVYGQKTYNGVALLSKIKPSQVWKGMNDEVDDPAARLIAGTFDGITVVCVYVPNGQEVGSEKYQYKLKWLARFKSFLKNHFNSKNPFVVCGDFNIAPEDQDVYDPKAWEGKILFSDPEKLALTELMNLGLVDTFRTLFPKQKSYTWWDYRNLSFPKDLGLRIDFILGSEPMIEHLEDSYVDRNERKGVQPSDHAPVISTFQM